jgi:methylglutaconyl-CoA hydratase
MENFVETSIEDGIGQVVLIRPDKRNALTREMILQLQSGFDRLAKDESLRLILFKAEGSVFCAGMDLEEMQDRAKSDDGQAEWQKDSEVYASCLKTIFEIEVPTIAVMQGPTLAGGVGMVLACDFILASSESFFMLPEPARGITAAIVTPFLNFRVAPGVANHLLLSGEPMNANRALEIGMVYDVVDPNDLHARVDKLVHAILTGSRSALAITKSHLRLCLSFSLEQQLSQSIRVSAAARETEDAREGLAAFIEKRQPAWNPKD